MDSCSHHRLSFSLNNFPTKTLNKVFLFRIFRLLIFLLMAFRPENLVSFRCSAFDCLCSGVVCSPSYPHSSSFIVCLTGILETHHSWFRRLSLSLSLPIHLRMCVLGHASTIIRSAPSYSPRLSAGSACLPVVWQIGLPNQDLPEHTIAIHSSLTLTSPSVIQPHTHTHNSFLFHFVCMCVCV